MKHHVSTALVLMGLGISAPALAQGRAGIQPCLRVIDNGDIASRQKDAELAGGVTSLLAPHCFTSGGGESYVQVCITERGNISRFESPQGVIHLSTREGYLLTSWRETGDPDHPEKVVHGFDAGSAEAGWNAPIVSQPNGPGTLPLIVTRTSSNGAMQLSQTFTFNATDRGVDIKMDVTNLSSVIQSSVAVHRYFDGDMNGSAGNDIYDKGRIAVWGHQKAASVYDMYETLSLSGAPSSSVAFYPMVETFAVWNPNGSTLQTARGNSGPVEATPTAAGDLVGRLIIDVGTVLPGQTRTMTVRYLRF